MSPLLSGVLTVCGCLSSLLSLVVPTDVWFPGIAQTVVMVVKSDTRTAEGPDHRPTQSHDSHGGQTASLTAGCLWNHHQTAQRIVSDPTHVLHLKYQLLPSGRRFHQCSTTFKKSFVPLCIKGLNDKLASAYLPFYFLSFCLPLHQRCVLRSAGWQQSGCTACMLTVYVSKTNFLWDNKIWSDQTH